MLDPNLPAVLGFRYDHLPQKVYIPEALVRSPCAGCGVKLLLTAEHRDALMRGLSQPICSRCMPGFARQQGALIREQGRIIPAPSIN